MKCPVCKTELAIGSSQCAVCEFDDLSREFVNVSDATSWVDNVVIPYRINWEKKRTKSPVSMYRELIAAQLNEAQLNEMVVADFEYEIDDHGAILTRYNGSSEHITIPGEIDGHTVYKLGNNLFYKCKELQGITLPDSLTEIGNGTFMCTGINSITLPNKISTIGRSAFYLSKLESIVLPESITVVGDTAFGRTKIKEIVFPEGISRLPARICESCDRLETVIILNACTIGEDAFVCCENLKNVVFAPYMESIEKRAFAYCTNFQYVILPPSLKSISSSAFSFEGHWTDPDNPQRSFVFQDSTTIINGWGAWEKCSVIFFCNKGSTAQHYAREYNIEQRLLSEFRLNR